MASDFDIIRCGVYTDEVRDFMLRWNPKVENTYENIVLLVNQIDLTIAPVRVFSDITYPYIQLTSLFHFADEYGKILLNGIFRKHSFENPNFESRFNYELLKSHKGFDSKFVIEEFSKEMVSYNDVEQFILLEADYKYMGPRPIDIFHTNHFYYARIRAALEESSDSIEFFKCE